MSVTPSGEFGYWINYYPMPDGVQLAHFIPYDEHHPVEPGLCECGCEIKKCDGGFYMLHKRDIRYLRVPDYLPEEV